MPKINLIRPSDGKVIQVDRSKLRSFVALGYQPEQPEQAVQRLQREGEKQYYGGGMNQAMAGVEGLASGLSLGLTDLAAGEGTRKRAEYNPGTRIATEIVGAMLPAFATGGASAELSAGEVGAELAGRGLAREALAATPAGMVGRLGAGVGERLGGGVVGRLGAGAVEGGIYGAGSELSHTGLSGDPLTAEGILASAGLGAMFGTGFAGAGASLEKLGGEAGGRVANVHTAEPVLERDAMAAFRGEPQGAYEAKWEQPRLVREPAPVQPYPTAKSAIDAREMASEGILPKERFEEFRASLKDARTASDRLTNQVEAAHEELNRMASKPAVERFQDAAGVGNDVYEQARKTPTKFKSELSSLRSRYRWVQEAIKEGDGPKIEAKLAAYKEAINSLAKAAGIEAKFSPEAVAGIKGVGKTVEDVAKFGQAMRNVPIVEDADAFFSMSPERAEHVLGSMDLVFANKLPETAAIRAGLEDVVSRMADHVGIKELEGGAAAKLRAVYSAGRAVREKAAEDYLNAAWAKPAYRVEGEPRYTVSSKPRATQPEAVKPVPEAKNAVERAEKGAKPSSHNDLIMRAAVGAAIGGPKGALVGVMLGGKAAVLSKVASAARRIASKILYHPTMERLGPQLEPLYHSLTGIHDTAGTQQAALAARSQEIRDLMAAGSGKDRAFLTAQALATAGHPELAKAAYDVSTKALEVLMKRMPKSPTGTTWGTDYLWEVPPEQMAVVSQEWQAGTAPADFLDWATSNPSDVFPTAVQVVKEAWPALYAEFQANALVTLAQTGTRHMDHEQLVGWSIMLDTTLSPTMEPRFITEQAAMHAQPPEQQPKPSGGNGGRPPGGANPATTPDATRAQQIEAR